MAVAWAGRRAAPTEVDVDRVAARARCVDRVEHLEHAQRVERIGGRGFARLGCQERAEEVEAGPAAIAG